jgi:uncharacterized DUF497 family protein
LKSTKREASPLSRGIDFADCDAVFDGPLVTWEDDRYPYGEQRLLSLGMLHGVVVLFGADQQPLIVSRVPLEIGGADDNFGHPYQPTTTFYA